MHQICVASVHWREKMCFSQEAVHVMKLLLSHDKEGKQEAFARHLVLDLVLGILGEEWGDWELGVLSNAGLSLLRDCSGVRWRYGDWPPLHPWEDVFSAFLLRGWWWGTGLWQALMVVQEASRACPRHILLAWPCVWLPSQRGDGCWVATLNMSLNSLPNSSLT